MSSGGWLETTWPVVAAWLPAPPARVVEIGCGPRGGFVPRLVSRGYDAIGVDPEAPKGVEYRRSRFEHAELPGAFEAVVASTSLHHVDDPAEVIGLIADKLTDLGIVVVIEWASENFDEQTVQWCFARLGTEEDGGWLHRHRERWLASGQDWETYFRAWVKSEGIHSGATLVKLLDWTFDRQHLSQGPYFFSGLEGATEEDEAAAIEAGEIRAARIDYVGRLRALELPRDPSSPIEA